MVEFYGILNLIDIVCNMNKLVILLNIIFCKFLLCLIIFEIFIIFINKWLKNYENLVLCYFFYYFMFNVGIFVVEFYIVIE